MSCPTCGHTMQSLGMMEMSAIRYFWCPRCGTLKSERCGHDFIESPKLVERCREFGKNHLAEHTVSIKDFKAWTGLGIAESINTPEDRPL